MIKIILFFALSSSAFAFDFNVGEYELLKGDEKVCEDGLLQIKNNDLLLGSRYLFPDYKKSAVKFSSDDKTCDYDITYINAKDKFVQNFVQTCKRPQENRTRQITFKYNNQQLIFSLEENHSTTTCLLTPVKK